MKKTSLLLLCLLVAAISVSAQTGNLQTGRDKTGTQYRFVAEAGFTSVLAHHIQLGQNGTYFDYVKDGGQNVLFPTYRFSIEVETEKRNTFILLYQPLRIETQALPRNDLIFYDVTFPASEGINALYNFPFYRFSYLRELTKNNPDFSFSIGLSLQIRNATISFESTDGSLYTDSRGIGPVPALKLRSQLHLKNNLYAEVEADGIYAPVSYLNGSDNEIVGAILDASLRLRKEVNVLTDLLLNVRYLGGGATGTDTGDVWPGDGYVKNWLNFLNVSAGVVINL